MEYGLIGEHLPHSFSKEIHGKLADYKYEIKELEKTELKGFITAKDFKGLNVTIPYKQDVIPLLDEVDEIAKSIGAVNTIVNRNGKLSGYNTDFYGLKGLIEYEGISLDGKKVLILGTGGTSKTATAVAKALKAKEILIASRSSNPGKTITYEEAKTVHNDIQVIINTTPCGMFPNMDVQPVELEPFAKLEAVVDVIYNPLKTKLVKDAEAKGIKACTGLFMLLQQAVAACEIFTGKKVSDEDVIKIFNELLAEKQQAEAAK